MNKLEANINIKDFEEFKVSHDILCEMLQDKNINVGIRLKYIHEFNKKIKKENNMNVPYVKVNNQKEFEKVVARMERETGLKLCRNTILSDIFNVVGVDVRNLTLIFDAEAHRNKSKISQIKSEIENEIKKSAIDQLNLKR